MVRLWSPIISVIITISLSSTAAGRPRIDDLSLAYPYGPHEGSTIEYASYFEGQGGRNGTQVGMTDGGAQMALLWNKLKEDDWDPDSTSVSKWLPPVDGDIYETRIGHNGLDYTNVFNRNRTLTRLWSGDDFWSPACARMAAELSRLQQTAKDPLNVGKNMGVTVRHYGASFPDDSNHNTSVNSFISVTVIGQGSNMHSTFGELCSWWFGDLVNQAGVIRPSLVDTTPTDLVVNGAIATYSNGTDVQLPPIQLAGTSGGGKAVQADDGSNFTLWVQPYNW